MTELKEQATADLAAVDEPHRAVAAGEHPLVLLDLVVEHAERRVGEEGPAVSGVPSCPRDDTPGGADSRTALHETDGQRDA